MKKKKVEKDSRQEFLETDLYPPVRDFLTNQGYTVRSEVKDCDVAACKDGHLIIVELKKNLSVDLLIQAVKRQKVADLVYMAIPKPKKVIALGKWKDLLHLIGRLELGLLFISFKGKNPMVEIVLEPKPFDRRQSIRKNQKKRWLLLKEMDGRSTDSNLGGSRGQKLVTAYRESSLYIACCLERLGPLSPKKLKLYGSDPQKTASILQKNFYGWFTRIKTGSYGLSEAGKEGLVIYEELANYYRNKLNELIDEKSVE